MAKPTPVMGIHSAPVSVAPSGQEIPESDLTKAFHIAMTLEGHPANLQGFAESLISTGYKNLGMSMAAKAIELAAV